MSESPYPRGAVVKAPDPFGAGTHRPYVHLTDPSHPFDGVEGLFVAVTTTERSAAVELADEDFVSGGLPRRSYASPWVVTTFKHADVTDREGRLAAGVVDAVAEAAAGYLGAST